MLGRHSSWSWNDFRGEQGVPTLGSFGVSHAPRSAFTDVPETDRKILPRKRVSPAPRMHASITEKPLMYFVIYLSADSPAARPPLGQIPVQATAISFRASHVLRQAILSSLCVHILA